MIKLRKILPIGNKDKAEKSLKRTRETWFGKVRHLFDRGSIGEELWEELEELLIAADVGVNTTAKLLQRVRESTGGVREASEIRAALEEESVGMLRVEGERDFWQERDGILVLLVVGVNGVGKTTSIAKLAHLFQEQGKRVILAAADTFRAAAIDQLQMWGTRVKTDVVSHQPGGDPGAVVYDALKAAKSRGAEVLIVDTAGRLHTKFNLMEELKKIKRVVDRADAGASQEVLLVLDATTGQNGLSQARYFTEAVGVTGVFLAKLDGTAKGGIVLPICDELKLPILFVGTGQEQDDLALFDAEQFAEALFA